MNNSNKKFRTSCIKMICKVLTWSFLTITLLIAQSCRITIPETDLLPPEFKFKISGDGFDRIFTQDDNFESFQLNLRENKVFNCLYTVGDDGGLQIMRIRFSAVDYEFETVPRDTWRDIDNGVIRTILWQGNINDPIKGNTLYATIRTLQTNPGSLVSSIIDLDMSDFGGSTGASNSIFKRLNIQIGNHDTEIIEF